MFVSALVVAVLAVSVAGPGQAEAQQRRPQQCVTPAGFLGSCRKGSCVGNRGGGPSSFCATGYSCCTQVTTSRPELTLGAPQVSPGRSQATAVRRSTDRQRKTLLNPQFECGGQPAPEASFRDPSAIVFPRVRRAARAPVFAATQPLATALVTGGEPEPPTNAVGVGVISPTRPRPRTPSLDDILARIGGRRSPLTRPSRPRFDGFNSNLLSPDPPAPPLPPPNRPGRQRGRRPHRFSGPPRRNYPRRNFHQRPGYGRRRNHYHQLPRNYRQPRNYYQSPRNHYHPQKNFRRRRRGIFEQFFSVLGFPARRRHRRSPQTPAEQAGFESVWREYQERVRTGAAPPGFTRQDILEAYRAAAQEAVQNSPSTSPNRGWTCGAVLISERYMLTAAHCLLAGQPQVVRLGDLNLTSTADGAPQEYLVQEVIQHPGYRHPLVYHDLALLKLDRTVKFSEHVKPFCLYDGRQSLVGKTSHVSGWGATEYGGDLSDILLGGNLTIWSPERCDRVYSQQPGFRRRLSDGITPDLLCAGGGKQDACQGDSGGPMTVFTEKGTRLAGIVSAGIGCGSPGIPGIYTNVARYVEWIDSVVYGGQAE